MPAPSSTARQQRESELRQRVAKLTNFIAPDSPGRSPERRHWDNDGSPRGDYGRGDRGLSPPVRAEPLQQRSQWGQAEQQLPQREGSSWIQRQDSRQKPRRQDLSAAGQLLRQEDQRQDQQQQKQPHRRRRSHSRSCSIHRKRRRRREDLSPRAARAADWQNQAAAMVHAQQAMQAVQAVQAQQARRIAAMLNRPAPLDTRLEPLLGHWLGRDGTQYDITEDKPTSLTVTTTRRDGQRRTTRGLISTDIDALVRWGRRGQYYLEEHGLPQQAVWCEARMLASDDMPTKTRVFEWSRVDPSDRNGRARESSCPPARGFGRGSCSRSRGRRRSLSRRGSPRRRW